MDAQADLSLRWAHSHFVGFLTRWLIFVIQLFQNMYTNIKVILLMISFGLAGATSPSAELFYRDRKAASNFTFYTHLKAWHL